MRAPASSGARSKLYLPQLPVVSGTRHRRVQDDLRPAVVSLVEVLVGLRRAFEGQLVADDERRYRWSALFAASPRCRSTALEPLVGVVSELIGAPLLPVVPAPRP